MKRNWLTRTLVVLLTLAMVVGVLAIKPREAKAGNVTFTTSPTSPVTLTAAGGSVTFTVTASTDETGGSIATYAWNTLADAPYSIPSTNSATYTFNKPGTYTVECTVTDSAGGTAKPTWTVNVGAFDITNSPNPATLALGDVITLGTKGVPSGSTVSWSGGNEYVSVDTNGKITALKGGAGATITATASASGSVTAQTATYTVTTVNKKTGALSFKDNPILLGTSTSYDLNNYVNKTHDQAVAWSLSGSVPAGVSLNGSTLTVGSTTGTFTVNASCSESDSYTGATATATAKIAAAATFAPSVTSMTISPYNSYTTITVTSTPSNGTITAQSLDSNVATVTGSGVGTATFTVQGKKTDNTYIRFRNSEGTGYVDVPVKVGNPTPTIKAWFDPDNYNLNKSTGYITLHIHVDNPQSNYVTIKRSNIRTYAKGYDTHDSTYYYTHYLDTDGDARFYIHPQYNGTTYYTVSATGASSVQTHNLTVSGYTTMPQTGPDYTWVYILSGLCVAALAAAVTLNVRKKKHQAN